MRNSKEQLRMQFESAHDWRIFFRAGSEVHKSHPTRAAVCVLVCDAVQKHITSSHTSDFFRENDEKCNFQPVNVFVHLLADKSQTSLKEGRLTFYSPSLTSLKITKKRDVLKYFLMRLLRNTLLIPSMWTLIKENCWNQCQCETSVTQF